MAEKNKNIDNIRRNLKHAKFMINMALKSVDKFGVGGHLTNFIVEEIKLGQTFLLEAKVLTEAEFQKGIKE